MHSPELINGQIESDDSDSDIEPATRRQAKRRRVTQSQLCKPLIVVHVA